ncbi:hypothetical protein [Streptomyces sp. NPDC017940]|uniref:hypothetical protein n=1 Tax=Streptomyces sp. NPDC017940 TaxID=3365017 RepID=UPI0037A51CFD
MTLFARLRLRTAGRRAALLGLLLMLCVPLVGTARAVQPPSTVPAAVTAPADDPCDQLPAGSPQRHYCEKDGDDGDSSDDAVREDGKDDTGSDGPADTSAPPATPAKDDEDPCKDVKGPAHDQCVRGEAGGDSDPLDTLTGDCKAAPAPEAPGRGILGWIDSGPKHAPAARDPKTADADAYLYEQYGYAGLKWNTYDLGCGGSVRDPMAATDNWLANRVFTWSKSWTALTVVLRQYATSDKLFGSLDPVVERATRAVRDAVYTPWIGVSLLLLGTTIIFQARKKNLPDVASQIAWALLVMTVATGVASYPVQASKTADDAINSTIAAIDQAFASVDLNGSTPRPSSPNLTPVAYPAAEPDAPGSRSNPYSEPSGDRVADRNAHGNMLVHSVLYQQWLRGELGDDDSKVARKYGVQLFDAQALTWREDRLPDNARGKVIKAKMEQFQKIAGKIKEEDPTAYSYLTGKEGGRLGAGTLSNFQALASNAFSMAADLVIVGGKITLKFLVILFPAIAVIGLHRKTSGAVKTAFHSGVAGAVNIPLFAVGGAIDVLVVREISDPQVDLPGWAKVVLLLLVSYVLWKMLRPLTRLSGMLNPNRNYLADAGDAFTAPGRLAGKAAKNYLGYRALRKIMANHQGTTSDEDLDDEAATEPRGRRAQRADDHDTDIPDHGYWGADDWPYSRSGDPSGPDDGNNGGSGAVLAPLGQDDESAHGSADHDSTLPPADTVDEPVLYDPARPGATGWSESSDVITHLSRPDRPWEEPAPASPGFFDDQPSTRSAPDSSTVSGPDLPGAAYHPPGAPTPMTGSDQRPRPPHPRRHAYGPGASSPYTAPPIPYSPELSVPATSDDGPVRGGARTSDSDTSGLSTPPLRPPEDERPYQSGSGDSQGQGPRVIPPTRDDDGGLVYVVYDPESGYGLRDERDDDHDGGER